MLVAGGVAFRVWLLTTPLAPVDGDEAVVGLMARKMLDGEFQAFFWGQEYGGVHESLLVALLMVVRVPDAVAMEMVPAALHAAAAVLVWRIGLRTVGARAGALAAGLFWATPAAFVWQSTKERAFYGAVLVAGLLAVLFALRLTARVTVRDAAIFGAACGTAFYASPQGVYLLAPAGLWVLLVTRGRGIGWRALAAAGAAGAVAAAPWFWANLQSGFASVTAARSLPDTSFGYRWSLFFRWGLPAALGLRVPVTLEWVFAGAKWVYGGSLAVLAATIAVWRRSLGPVALGTATYPVVFAVLPASFYVSEPRYLYLLSPLVLLIVARAASALPHGAARLGAVALVVVLAGVGLGRLVDVRDERGNRRHDLRPRDLSPVVAVLDAMGVDHVFADYWASYRLAWLTDERIVASPVRVVRYEPYEDAVRSTANPPYVFVRASCDDVNFRRVLDERAVSYTARAAGDWVVVQPATKLLPEHVFPEWAVARGLEPTEPNRCDSSQAHLVQQSAAGDHPDDGA